MKPTLLFSGLLGLAFWIAPWNAPSATLLEIWTSAGVDLEGRPQFELRWIAESNATYRIQHRASLAPGGSWKTMDVVRSSPQGGQQTYPFPQIDPTAGFFRLLLPEPEIFSVEPARFALGGPVEFHVIGQLFGPDTELRASPLTLSNVEIINSGLMRGSFTPPVAGVYVFELVVQGNVVSSFAVECFDPVAPPPSVLQGPPEEPWASPVSNVSEDMVISVTGLHGKEQASRPPCGSNPRVTPSGEVELDEVDLFIPGRGLDFIWGRRYRSRSGTNTLQGNRWDYSYNVSAQQVVGGIEVRDGMGRADVFAQAADGTFTRDEHFSVGTLTGTVFRLTFADTGYWEFLPFDGSPAAGRLERIVDRNANTLRLEYDGVGRLARVIDTLGRTNSIQYILGKIFSVADFTGRGVIYTYYNAVDPNGTVGDLKSVTSPAVTNTPNGNDFPAGKTTTYTYARGFADPRENSLLLTIVDANNQLAHRHVYQHNQTDLQFLRCISRQVGNSNDVLTYNYLPQTPSPSNQFAALKIIVNDRMGNVSERSFDARHRLLLQRDFTGRAIPGLHVSETTNRPINKLRATDPDFFETRYEWNNDSLCTRIVHPRGNETQRLHEREFDATATARKKGDLRVLRETSCCAAADVDRDGQPDLASRVWQHEYNPGFGSPGFRSPSPGIQLSALDPPEADEYAQGQWFKAGGGGNENWLFAGGVRPIRSTDARGNVTTASLDIRGNLVRKSDPFTVGNDPPVVEFAYNPFGQLTGVTNALDGQGRRRVDTFTYHASGPQAGYLASVRRDDGGLNLLTSYEYDARGNVTRRIDPRGSDELFTYNVLDQVVRAQSRPHVLGTGLRIVTDYFYDGNDNVVRVDHENRNEAGTLDSTNPHWTSLYEYDVLDRLTLVAREISSSTSLSNRFRYDANGNLTRVELPEAVSGADSNNVVAHTYDERNLLFESVAAPGTGLGATNRWDYDANANCRKVSKIDSFVIKQKTLEYDGLDRLAAVIDGMGNEALLTRNAKDDVIRHRLLGELTDVPGGAGNRLLSETRYEYDVLDRLTRTRESFFDTATGQPVGDGEAISTFTCAPNGLSLSSTDDNGRTTHYAYDTANRLMAVTDPGSNVVSFTCDANGNMLTRTQTDLDHNGNALPFTVILEYDDLDRPLGGTDDQGNNENWSFDSRDNIVRHTDPRGNDSRYEYDGLSRLTRATFYDGQAGAGIVLNSSRVTYLNSRLVSSTDGNSNTTFYAYDSLDRRTLVTSPDGNVHTFLWDAFGNVATEQDANGTVTVRTYDALDRCMRKDITPAQGVAATTTFEEFNYNGASQLVRAGNDIGNPLEPMFIYDSTLNMIRQSQTAGGVTLVSTATFDGVGNRLSLTHPSGRVVSTAFDALDRPASVSFAMGGPAMQLATFAYAGPGRLARIARANGIETHVQWNGSQNPPNAAGDFGWQQVAGVSHQVTGGGASIDTRTLAYDRAQNKILRAQTVPFIMGGQLKSNVWSHDALNRLSSSDFFVGNDPPSTRDYQLDPNGNRQAVIDNGLSRPYQMSNMLPEPGDFQMNQYTLSPFGAHEYDRNGNLLSTDRGTGPTLYQYDYADRLVSVQRMVGQTLESVADYAYDALGRRVSTTIHLPPPMAPLTNRFFHDIDGAIIEERLNGNLSRSYVIPEIDDEVLVAFTAGGQAQYYHSDDLGNVLALTDAAGNVLERYDYDDYGMPRFLDANGDPLPATESPAGNPFLFRGMFWDPETALYSGEFDPATGRYIMRSGAADDGNNFNWDFSGRTFAGDNPWSDFDTHFELLSATGTRICSGGDGPKTVFVKVRDRHAGGGWVGLKPKCRALASGGVGGTYQVSAYWTSQTSRDSGASGSYQVSARWVSSNTRANGGGIGYNSSRSNKGNIMAGPGSGGGGGNRGSGIDYNSSRSNKSNAIAGPGNGNDGDIRVTYTTKKTANPGSGGSGPVKNGFVRLSTTKAQGGGIDYNSSRSNKSSAFASPGGGGEIHVYHLPLNSRVSGGGIDYNSSRSNKSNGIAPPGGGGGVGGRF